MFLHNLLLEKSVFYFKKNFQASNHDTKRIIQIQKQLIHLFIFICIPDILIIVTGGKYDDH